MKYSADSPIDYIDQLPEERKKAFNKLRKTVLDNIPKGYEECMNYGMLGYVVPKSIYPAGYHCDPKLPLPFTNIASQKILLLSTTWVFMLTKSYFSGFKRNMHNSANTN